MDIMTPYHPEWDGFAERLEGAEGCNFQQKKKGDPASITWQCDGTHAKARTILATIPDIDIEGSIEYFERHGGYCDCEILFNVDKS